MLLGHEKKMKLRFKAAYAKGGTQFLLHMIYAGFTYYMYNEVSAVSLVLTSLTAASHQFLTLPEVQICPKVSSKGICLLCK